MVTFIHGKRYWTGQKMWDGKITTPVKTNYKISICITCMDRLNDLSLTLPFNIEHKAYPSVEFILLDYNSHKDDVGKWVKEKMSEYIESGLLTYYRTGEPKYYTMAHSRNVAFNLASGDIILNVDADNFIQPRDKVITQSFCEYVNILANQSGGEKAIFAKGKRMMHGRLGFFKKEFISIGGFDEKMCGYGYDDIDLMRRAWALGFTLYWFGGLYVDRIKTSNSMKGENMQNRNWRKTEWCNQQMGYANLDAGIFVSNQGTTWAKCHVTKNFKEEMDIAIS